MPVAVAISALCSQMGWSADSIEARLLRSADGARPGFARNGLINANELQAYLRRPGDAAFVTYERLSELTELLVSHRATSIDPLPGAAGALATPVEGTLLIRSLTHRWQRSLATQCDANGDGTISESEFTERMRFFLSTQADHRDSTSVTSVPVSQGPALLSDQRLAVILAAIANHTDDANLMETCRGAPSGMELSRDYFTACYEPGLRVPLDVAYALSSSDLAHRGAFPRVDSFAADPFLLSAGIPAARPATYSGTGFDQGHQMPFEDHSDSRSRQVTFLMTNMVPQAGNMNRQVWRRLEAAVHELVETRGGRAVIHTGPLWLDESGNRVLPGNVRIGADRTGARPSYSIAVPTHCFKIVLYYPPNEAPPVAFAYRVRNIEDLPTRDEPVGELLRASEVTINELERQSGLDFFNDLPNRTENALESALGGFARAVSATATPGARPPTRMMDLLLPRVPAMTLSAPL